MIGAAIIDHVFMSIGFEARGTDLLRRMQQVSDLAVLAPPPEISPYCRRSTGSRYPHLRFAHEDGAHLGRHSVQAAAGECRSIGLAGLWPGS